MFKIDPSFLGKMAKPISSGGGVLRAGSCIDLKMSNHPPPFKVVTPTRGLLRLPLGPVEALRGQRRPSLTAFVASGGLSFGGEWWRVGSYGEAIGFGVCMLRSRNLMVQQTQTLENDEEPEGRFYP